MDYQRINTLRELKEAGYRSRGVHEEVRENLVKRLRSGDSTFTGIVGYEDTVIPAVERALLSRHNILFLGLRGQAKTRMARQMTALLDEYIPVVSGSEINDDPFNPVSAFARAIIRERGDDTPIEWLHRGERYGEKLATPDVSVADLIGDIDPIKAANQKLSFSDERAINYGIIPKSNRGVFVINELPDLQARIQVSLFNILEEGDVQIRGFKLRMPLDILFVFTANPEDYTNRGSIVTPLKDRIQSQILTHYPRTIEQALEITAGEASVKTDDGVTVHISPLLRRLVEGIAFEARGSEYVDKKSGVSARLTIAALETAVSAAERRLLRSGDLKTQVWVSDLAAVIPAITGKIELLYEGEQEGPLQVAVHLIDKTIRSTFVQTFPDPEALKKRRSKKGDKGEVTENPYRRITSWFDKGGKVVLSHDVRDAEKKAALEKVDGLRDLVKKYAAPADAAEEILLMEFLLYGLAANSSISRKSFETSVEFSDLMGSMMMGLGGSEEDEDE